MVLNLSNFCEADIDARVFVLQPEPQLHKVAGIQQIGRSHLRVGLGEFQDTPVSLETTVDADQHAVDRKIRDGPAGLMFPQCHDVTLE